MDALKQQPIYHGLLNQNSFRNVAEHTLRDVIREFKLVLAYIFILYISKDSLKNLCHNGSTSMANLCKLMGSGFPNFGFSLTVMHMNKIDEIIKPIIFYFAIIAI